MAISLTTTQTTEVALKPTLKKKLLASLQTYAKLHAQLKAIETEMDALKGTIGGYREEAGVETLAIEGFHVTRVSGGTRESLNKMKLIEMGVTLDMLAEATDVKPVKPFEKITVPSVKGPKSE